MAAKRIALITSPSEAAQQAAAELRASYRFAYDFSGADIAEADWDNIRRADVIVALGGDGFLLHLAHQMIDSDDTVPIFGMNRGTVGFLMNEYRGSELIERIAKARMYNIRPLRAHITTIQGEQHRLSAINEISLFRETRHTAKIEVIINERIMLDELIGDGILVATPAGSTAYNLSAQGPILPLDSAMLALTPISLFRPRRWRGAILPESTAIRFTVREAEKRPVSAVADQREIREICAVDIAIDPARSLSLLFDPEHGLDDRIVQEQFI